MPQTDTAGLEGLRVRVYYNLHKKCLSIKHRRLVVAHVDEITLKDVKFIVSEAGRQRVIREKRKNVHAFVEGIVCTDPVESDLTAWYNPYKTSTFRVGDDPILIAHKCTIRDKKIHVDPV